MTTKSQTTDDDWTVEELIEINEYREAIEHSDTDVWIEIMAGNTPEDNLITDTRSAFRIHNAGDIFIYEFDSYVDEDYEFDRGDADIPHKIVAEFLEEPVQFAIDKHGLKFDHGSAYEVTRCEVKDREFVFGVLDELEELIDE